MSENRGRKVQVKCEGCGIMFEARVADRKRGWGRFHSKTCKAVHQEKRTGQYKRLRRMRAECEDPGDDMYWAGKEYN